MLDNSQLGSAEILFFGNVRTAADPILHFVDDGAHVLFSSDCPTIALSGTAELDSEDEYDRTIYRRGIDVSVRFDDHVTYFNQFFGKGRRFEAISVSKGFIR